MPYKKNSSRKFVAPLFLAEDRYWEDYMRPYLEKEGWCVVEVDCAGVQGTRDLRLAVNLTHTGLKNLLLKSTG